MVCWQWLIANLALAENTSGFLEMSDGQVQEILAALAHPVRFQIFQSLRGLTGKSAGDLAMRDLSAPAVTHHLRQMERAGVLICTKRGRNRIYSIDPKMMSVLGRWWLKTTELNDGPTLDALGDSFTE
jgi:DNA-binding transcriptional ArsR family regulator